MEGNAVCMLTGVVDPGSEAEGLEEYITDYLTKPFTAEDLAEMVTRAEESWMAQ